jgi:hypothetical protein
MDGQPTDRPSVKLDHQNAGPLIIDGMKRHSYKLKLPKSIEVYNLLYGGPLTESKFRSTAWLGTGVTVSKNCL